MIIFGYVKSKVKKYYIRNKYLIDIFNKLKKIQIAIASLEGLSRLSL